MDFTFPKEYELLRRTIREFAETHVAPLAEEIDRDERVPHETIEKAAKLGLLGVPFPQKYGGAGAGEIGHTTILLHGGEICTCGNTGCLETLLSEPVWIQHAEELAAAHPESLLSKYLNLEDERTPIERAFSAARDGDNIIQQFIEERA